MGEQFYNTHLFAEAMTTPALISHHQLTPPPTTFDPASMATIKMEDAEKSSSVAFSASSLPPTSHPSTPSASEGKSSKKRKSWGQVLPEPKTNLPPRKRAKTEDEKEQRRIERVKRNRLAAHNSRERKRQEVELLQLEKDKLEADLDAARATMARMAAQLKAFQQRHPGEIPEQSFDTTAPIEDYESVVGQSDTICPRQTSFPSPVSMDSLDSPRDDSCQPETPAYSESVVTELDQTRYPAAILCDLQCRSSSRLRSPQLSSLQLQATLAFLILFNLTLPSMRSLLMSFSASTSSLINPLAWLKRQTSSPHLSSTTIPQIPMAFLNTLMQSTSTCRQPLAQHMLATGLSQRRSSNKWVARPSETRGRAGQGAVEGSQRSQSFKVRKGSRRQEAILSLKPELKRWLESLEVQHHDGDGDLNRHQMAS